MLLKPQADTALDMVRAKSPRVPLTYDEREGIVLAVNSAFRKLKNLYAKVGPIIQDFDGN